MSSNRYDVIPGASLDLALTVTDLAGAAVDLTGATVEATLTAGSGFSEALGAAWDAVGERWLVNIGAAYTLQLVGRQAKLRVFATPAASVETTAVEATINVKP